MKNALNTARRWALHFQMRSLEIQIDGMSECLDCVRDPLIASRIQIARSVARRELAGVRSRYNETLPPGSRATWRMA